jgi:signal transduction histidine kinase
MLLGSDTSVPGARASRLARRRTLSATALGVVVTASILAPPYVTFGFESPSVHLVLDTLDAAVGALAAFLVLGRFERHGRLQDLLLVQGLVLMVVAGLGLDHVGEIFADAAPGTLDIWLPLVVRVTGTALIAAAAVAGPMRPAGERRGSGVAWVVVLASVVSVLVAVLVLLRDRLPVALDPEVIGGTADGPMLTGHPLLVSAQLLSLACLALAAVLFTVQAHDDENELLLWLGPACALGAFARLNYVLYPSLYTDWLYTGDLLRTGLYALLLVGAAREIRRYWTAQAALAVLDDRRRLARELHDGVLQELSFIHAQAPLLIGDPDAREQVVRASQRGLEEARAAVAALGASGDEPLKVVLARATRQLAEQYDVDVVLQLEDVVVEDAEERHALVRIAREAVTNAVKHGEARTIEVTLGREAEGRHLVVRDDGSGFDVEAALANGASGGYGLVSMRDRARGLAGRLDIESSPGAGSMVTVTW